MAYFTSDGHEISYIDRGQGKPVLLIHGFASSKDVNWVHPGWVKTLTEAGYRVIAIDNRGHGRSAKLYDPALYSSPIMAEDAKHLLDHLEIDQAYVMGYSMGARISAFLSLKYPERVKRVVFGGLGSGMIHGTGDPAPIISALEAEDPASINHVTGKAFRTFADQTGSDRLALAACMKSARQKITVEELAELSVPALVAVGTRDVISGKASELADILPSGEAVDIPDRDHMLAVGDKVYKEAVLEFFGRDQ
ncbi:alpha/beta fold hydrolase [Cohaesibacter gelatinilyticus]|mgnify:CR=1 FL=1|uniref:Pimeloyl-ACP methyl ester carboxylesterase n=1 Tax=Cohaesibacter gelatinilyticus TaxID=372072 RepID=A0A285NG67_9HYPH|nr:alpha/beta hydrolase [Cohaesibacter gelatinilyticus]SNZ08504.1 Pimeloyl-ACP methyl ester carboxylesterase [Cohaesibacter gelatinilyticus]